MADHLLIRKKWSGEFSGFSTTVRNGKDLPGKFGAKSTGHRWFQCWVKDGVFEKIMRDVGKCVEERDGYPLYECFIDGTFSKAKGGGDGIGKTESGKGVKFTVWVDARGFPIAVDTGTAGTHPSRLAQPSFDVMLTEEVPPVVIGDKAYDSDPLDWLMAKQGVEMVAPHRSNRKIQNNTQDGRPLRRYRRRWKVERMISWIQNDGRLYIR